MIDDGVDFAHPDIMGAQKIYNSAGAPQYNGWPMLMDPSACGLIFTTGCTAPRTSPGSFGGVTYADTSATPPLSSCGYQAVCVHYTPMIDYSTPGTEHMYIFGLGVHQERDGAYGHAPG